MKASPARKVPRSFDEAVSHGDELVPSIHKTVGITWDQCDHIANA
jgi:hypothetical protein